jgi:serine phosphatase RsbU (regulator of sigma subunit)/ligand-binding sensor domain-containing protein
MNKMNKYFFTVSVVLMLFCFPVLISAQEGSPFITNFAPDDESLNENYSLCQGKDGVLVIANRKGIIVFDGDEWKIVKTPELPLTLALSSVGDEIFVGCRNAIGYIRKNYLGEYEYSQIAGKEAGLVLQIVILGNDAYFLSQSAITRIKIDNFKDIKYFRSTTNKPFQYMMVLNNELLVDVFEEGLQLISKDAIKPKLATFPLSGKIIFNVTYNDKTALIGASDNKCYLFDGTTVKPYELQDQQYLTDGNILDGRLVDENRVVVSTSSAGCLVFDKKTGKTSFTVNYQTGLPDDEVIALATDKNQGIWLAHYYGLTRIDGRIPVKNYTYFKGLSGKPQATIMFRGKIYVGTSNGLYFLDKKKDYIEYTIKPVASKSVEKLKKPEEKKVEQYDVVMAATNSPSVIQVPAKEKKRGLFSKLFSKKEKAGEQRVQAETEQKNVAEEEKKSGVWNLFGAKEPAKEKQLAVQKVYKLASISHIYAKVPGFEHKCRQLVEFKGHLLAVTITGIFDVTETEASALIPDAEVNYVYSVSADDALYICTGKGVSVAKLINNKWEVTDFQYAKGEPVYSFAKDMFDNYWLGGENKVMKVKLKKDLTLKESNIYNFGSEYRERVIVRLSNKKPIFFMSSGIYSIFNDSIQKNLALSAFTSDKARYYFTQQDYTWINNTGNWICLSSMAEPDTAAPNYLNLFTNVSHVYVDNKSNLWIIDENSLVFKIDQKGIEKYQTDFNAFIKRFTGMSGEAFSLNGVELDRNNNYLKIIISAPYFVKSNSNQYQIFVKGLMLDWSNWTSNPEFNLTLPSGQWEVNVRAKNIFGNISLEQVLKFDIKKPFYNTWWFYLLCTIAAIGLIYLFIKYRERQLQHDKEVLEQKVRERTKQIAEQKEEIEAQRDEITVINREITDSIRYAQRLQTAVMPDNEAIANLLSDYFVVFRPKDIVSGDFFWAKMKNEKVIVAAVDCTGHGVPGGFLSMLGTSFLNEISAMEKEYKANEILNILRARVKGTLIKEGHENETKDGMDICLCIIDQKNKKVQYAGANNPLYLIRDKAIMEFDADKMPIGAYLAEKESFTNNEIDLLPNDELFLFSDGFRDQLGGPLQKRLKSPGFRKLLLDVNDKPMKTQKELLEKFFDEWRGHNEQVDDILVFGIKV